MSEIKTNKISPRRGTTTTIGDSGDSVTISSGTTTTNAGTISTAGITGGTINNTTGTISGLQQQIDWQTGSIKTANFNASANEGYFINTTSGEITVTLPASPSAGDVVAVKDYADTFDTNKAIINPNGNKIQGFAIDFHITVEGTAAVFLYIDSTQGWKLIDQSKAADIEENKLYITATGGTITTSGDFKIHTFTGPGTFCVSQIGNPAGGGAVVDYVVVAGAGGSGNVTDGNSRGGGGGAGGFRESHSVPVSGCYTASPLATPTGITLTATGFPITVGAGGPASCSAPVGNGSNSVFSTITSTGGGHGASHRTAAQPGGSGGAGAPGSCSAGSGNSPPVSPPQGTNGSAGSGEGPFPSRRGGGGGGATDAGGPGSSGGAGATTNITASPVTYAAGGSGSPGSPNNAGAANTGNGGNAAPTTGGNAGGSGIVIIRYKYQN